MTMPCERTRAVSHAREFLRDLLDPKKVPRIRYEIRQRARRVLKHFPGEQDMEQVIEKVPKIFGKRSES